MKPSDSKYDLDIKSAPQKSDGGMSVRSDLKKLDSFTFESSKNNLIRGFLRNGRLRVKASQILTPTVAGGL